MMKYQLSEGLNTPHQKNKMSEGICEEVMPEPYGCG